MDIICNRFHKSTKGALDCSLVYHRRCGKKNLRDLKNTIVLVALFLSIEDHKVIFVPILFSYHNLVLLKYKYEMIPPYTFFLVI